MTTKKTSRFTHYDELLAVRMGATGFTLSETALPQITCETTGLYVEELLALGFIFSHELSVTNAVGKDEGDPAAIIAYIKADDNAYALVTDLYHEDCWVHFTSFFPDGTRITTTSQPGVLSLEKRSDTTSPHRIQNVGSTPIESQWKRHKRFIATEVPEKSPLLFKPVQQLALEEHFYDGFVADLLRQNILQQSDTQTVRFTRSGARNFHLALTSRSAKRPASKAGQWMTKPRNNPLKAAMTARNLAFAGAAVVGLGIIALLLQSREFPLPLSGEAEVAALQPPVAIPPETDEATSLQVPDVSTVTVAPDEDTAVPAAIDEQKVNDRQNYLIADQEDEMWRIAVENAEFFLLSNDGDPAPWIRTARKIAAGFTSDDSRLARTYFLSALLEPDFRIAEQQFNRALSIQTKTLGLYHAETAQTLEALAWIAEHNKDDLDEAITHQQLAINIYRDIFGPEAEDTQAAEWKLAYFEDRLSGVRPKSDSNRRLLPALARFSR